MQNPSRRALWGDTAFALRLSSRSTASSSLRGSEGSLHAGPPLPAPQGQPKQSTITRRLSGSLLGNAARPFARTSSARASRLLDTAGASSTADNDTVVIRGEDDETVYDPLPGHQGQLSRGDSFESMDAHASSFTQLPEVRGLLTAHSNLSMQYLSCILRLSSAAHFWLLHLQSGVAIRIAWNGRELFGSFS